MRPSVLNSNNVIPNWTNARFSMDVWKRLPTRLSINVSIDPMPVPMVGVLRAIPSISTSFSLGVLYGHGAYFHAHAQYSHNYAQADPSGERTVFLARVLIGKTIKGDNQMRVAPPGYDTTTDGEHIFVVYHDAGAYAGHLITYKWFSCCSWLFSILIFDWNIFLPVMMFASECSHRSV